MEKMKSKKSQTGTVIKVIGWACISAGGFISYIPQIKNKIIGYLLAGIGFLFLGIGEFFR